MLTRATTDPAEIAAPRRRYRTIFISDLHLGSRGCKADCLLDLLRHVESDTLRLVGDIVDGWRLKKRWFWPEKHAEVLGSLMARALAGVKVRRDVIHEAAAGRRLLVVHGDVLDGGVTEMRWLALVGSVAYERCRTYAGRFSWRRCAEQFLGHLQRISPAGTFLSRLVS